MRRTKANISVALCSYNGSKFIHLQLQSIINQTRQPDEIVICDDGSTDGTCGILEGFAQAHPNLIRYYKNVSNLGYSNNFGKAISL